MAQKGHGKRLGRVPVKRIWSRLMFSTLLRSKVALTILVLLCWALVFPGVGQAQTEDEVAKQIVAAGGIVVRDEEGKVDSITLRPQRAKDFNHIDFGVFKNIKMVTVCGPEVTDQLLVQLQAIPPTVKILKIFIAPLTDEALAGLLRKQKWLVLVDLVVTPITDKSLAELSKLQDLHTLFLDETKITDKGLKNLAKSQLTYLSLRDTGISDVGLLELKGMTTLRQLFLEGTKVTDGGIQNLGGLQDLKLLGVSSTNVTENGKMLLRATLPELKYYERKKRPK